MPESVLHCPLTGTIPFVPCDPCKIDPLVEFLQRNLPASGAVFPRGTFLRDGRLDLCKQNLGPDGCERVTNALLGHDHVRSLLLGTDGIGDRGAVSVAKLIAHNDSLEVVYLGCNLIGPAGTEALATALLS